MCRVAHWHSDHSKTCRVKKDPPWSTKYTEVSNSDDSLLGKGAYGFVKLIRDRETGKLFALKVLNKEQITEEAGLEIIKREIEIHQNLDHDNIIRLYEFLEDEESVYLILEYAAHGSLFQRIKKQKKFTEEKAKN